MSLLDDIIESDKIQNLVKQHPYLDVINKLHTDNKTNVSNKTDNPSDPDNEYVTVSQTVVNESKEMDNQLKTNLVAQLFDNVGEKPTHSYSQTFQELEFFTSNRPDGHTLFSKIDLTQTILGKHRLKHILTTPTNNGEELQKRQRLLTYFKENPGVLPTVRSIISESKDLEGDVLWFFKQASEEIDNMLSMMYFKSFWNKWLNNNQTLLNIYYNMKLVFFPLYGLLSPLIVMIGPYFIINYILKLKIPFKTYWVLIKKMYFSGGGMFSILDRFFMIYQKSREHNNSSNLGGGGGGGGGSNSKNTTFNIITELIIKCTSFLINLGITKILYNCFMVFSYGYGIYSTINYSYSYLKIIKLFNQKLTRLSKFILNTQHLHDKLSDIMDINDGYNNDDNDIKNDKNSRVSKTRLDYKTDGYLSQIDHPTFCSGITRGNSIDCDKLILSNKGITLKLFRQTLDNNSRLLKYMEFLGNIDAWSSIGELYTKSNEIQKWTLPAYIKTEVTIENTTENTTDDITEKRRPEIDMEGFRNIMIDSNSVENSIHIGGGSDDDNGGGGDSGHIEKSDNKNLMITGPNASGKSTFLKAITECLLLGQTIGVVPCHKMKFTPFKEINTYLNIPDCQGKESLFQAEMERCFNQIQSIKKLPPNEYVFSIMDEIFVSTNYYEGISGAYAISEKMGRFDNSMCIISTHFPTLSKFCQKKGHYTNYHFGIDEKTNTKSYKIIKGSSKQHIALKMLKEKGFDNDIIKDANKMYAYLLKEKAAKGKDGKENVKENVNVNKKDVVEDNLKEKN